MDKRTLVGRPGWVVYIRTVKYGKPGEAIGGQPHFFTTIENGKSLGASSQPMKGFSLYVSPYGLWERLSLRVCLERVAIASVGEAGVDIASGQPRTGTLPAVMLSL